MPSGRFRSIMKRVTAPPWSDWPTVGAGGGPEQRPDDRIFGWRYLVFGGEFARARPIPFAPCEFVRRRRFSAPQGGIPPSGEAQIAGFFRTWEGPRFGALPVADL